MGPAAYCGSAFAADHVKKELGLVGAAIQRSIFLKSNEGLAKAGPHLFIQDHVDRTVLPTGHGAIDVSIGADQGMISFYHGSCQG